MLKNTWYTIKNQSLAIYARNAGFDLAVYHEYSENVKAELRSRAVKEALFSIENECTNQNLNLETIKAGIYVISLSNPLSIKYRKFKSQVIYIGKGNIKNRIKAHFNLKLFDFMLDLSGANFDFHFAQPALSGTAEYFTHVEHLMLEYFSSEYGGLDDKKRFPILNKNAGNNKQFNAGTDWWKKPLKASGKKPLWELTPTDFSHYAPLDVTD